MRHVRMLGLCLTMIFAVGALVAIPAVAAKDPYNVNTWTQYENCPFHNEAFNAGTIPECFVGRTVGGGKGGFFTLGNVTVKLSKPIILHGGFIERSASEESTIEAEATECNAHPAYNAECQAAEQSSEGVNEWYAYKSRELKVFPAEGSETLVSPEFKVAGGLGLITKQIQERQEWPEALKRAFNEAKKNKEASLYVKIEVAGNTLYEDWGGLNVQRLLNGEGAAFVLPLKVRLISPFLERLGGGSCTVGNDASPVMQTLTTESPGRPTGPEGLQFNEGFTQTELPSSRLVDLNWSVPMSADAKGCGGMYESYLDGAVNEVLELPYQHGSTFLQGDLFTTNESRAKEELEK